MNFKKYISLAMVCALALGSTVAFAEGEYNNANSIETSLVVEAISAKKDVVSLEQIVGLATENNRTYKLYESKIAIAKSASIRANSSADSYEEDISRGAVSGRLTNAYGAYLAPIQKENALNQLLREQENALEDLKNTVKDQYFDILLSQNKISSKEADIKYYEDQLRNKESELSLGKVTNSDVTAIEVNLKNAKLDLKKLEATIDAQFMAINITINKPLDYRFETVEVKFDNEPFVVEDMDAQIAYNVENDDSILTSKETLVELKEELTVIKVYSVSGYSSSEYTDGTKIESLNTSVESMENTIVTNTLNVEYNLRKSYNELQNSFDDIEIAKLNYDLAVKDAEIGQIKYDAGLINGLDYRKTIQTRDDQKSAYDTAEMNYLLVVENFKADFY